MQLMDFTVKTVFLLALFNDTKLYNVIHCFLIDPVCACRGPACSWSHAGGMSAGQAAGRGDAQQPARPLPRGAARHRQR